MHASRRGWSEHRSYRRTVACMWLLHSSSICMRRTHLSLSLFWQIYKLKCYISTLVKKGFLVLHIYPGFIWSFMCQLKETHIGGVVSYTRDKRSQVQVLQTTRRVPSWKTRTKKDLQPVQMSFLCTSAILQAMQIMAQMSCVHNKFVVRSVGQMLGLQQLFA